jgi:hypothetical protein
MSEERFETLPARNFLKNHDMYEELEFRYSPRGGDTINPGKGSREKE